jgi:hypothetical protein
MQVKAGDIFECEGSFYQAIKATAKTATIRPIESTFEGLADAYGWERKYMPLPNCFTYDPIMGREASDNGKRLKVRGYTSPHIPATQRASNEQMPIIVSDTATRLPAYTTAAMTFCARFTSGPRSWP